MTLPPVAERAVIIQAGDDVVGKLVFHADAEHNLVAAKSNALNVKIVTALAEGHGSVPGLIPETMHPGEFKIHIKPFVSGEVPPETQQTDSGIPGF